MLQRLWSQHDAAYLDLFKKFERAKNGGFHGSMRDWKPNPTNIRLTEYQMLCKNRPNKVKYIKRAELDGTLFCTTEWSDGKVTDNSFVKSEFEEQENDQQVHTSYGRITKMFLARKYAKASKDITIVGDWFDKVGVNPVSRNVQVRYNANFSTQKLEFLRNCVPQNLTLVPSRPVELDEVFSDDDDEDDDDDDDDDAYYDAHVVYDELQEDATNEIKENDQEIDSLFDVAFDIDQTVLFDVVDD